MNWVHYFERNRETRRTIPWERGITVEPHVRNPLIRSLQRFQIGESGEGRHMKRGAARTGNAEYARAVHLFIEEEQYHSAIMGQALDLLGAPRLKRHWSDVFFVGLRRTMGLTCEVLVLLAAEVVGRNFFRTAYHGVDDAVLRAMLAQMIDDEEAHVAFQADHLRSVLQRMPAPMRFAVRLAWWAVYNGAFLVVVWDHRHLFRALQVSPTEFMSDCDGTYDDVCAVLFRHRVCAYPAVAGTRRG
ncbi:MAG TPA: ferritin-like domain-containing protein [Candidatus Kapabacteria bacterium]|nr:ferritin-like domain-containing protein [Candidatus Kapabacteria bacterium]